MNRRGAVEEARTGEPGAVGLERLARGLLDTRVAGEPEVVVRAEHDPLGALHLDHGRRRRLEAPEVRDEVGLLRRAEDLHALVAADGRVIAERSNPRESFNGHVLTTPWDPLQRAYFNGYALWTYLTTPFLMTLPGFTVTEIDPIEDNGERWSGLRAHFPDHFPSHSSLQEFYFDSEFLLRRHDYRVDVAGGFAATNTSTTWWRPTGSSCRPGAGRTAATTTAG